MSDKPEVECDSYGNPIDGDRLIYCCFPDCGCDGERLCMAENGASDRALRGNVEGMYSRSDKKARRAKMELLGMVVDDERTDDGFRRYGTKLNDDCG